MQSQNIFTVGGSISVNVHGRDIRYGSLMDTVKSMRLLQADGSIIEISRTKHPELFSLVNGGYGVIWSDFRCDASFNGLMNGTKMKLSA